MEVQEALKILEIEAPITLEALKEAYYDLLHVWHPDRHQEHARRYAKAERKTRQINQAYEVLLHAYFPKEINPSPSLNKEEAWPEVLRKACERHRLQWFKKGFDLNWHLLHSTKALEKIFWENLLREAQTQFKNLGGKKWPPLEPLFQEHIRTLEMKGECQITPQDFQLHTLSPHSAHLPRLKTPWQKWKGRRQENDMWAYLMTLTVLYDYQLEIHETPQGSLVSWRK